MTEIKKTDLGTDVTLVGPEHTRVYKETGGETGYIWNGVPILLLTTKGRKSGEDRTIPIIYRQVGDTYVIIGSVGGSPKHPAWYLNILEDPNVTIQIKREIFNGKARVAVGEERQELWDEALKGWPNYNVYQTRTTRVIPVVALQRVSPG